MYFALGIAFLARRKLLLFKFVGLGMLSAALPFLLLLGLGNDANLWKAFAVLFLSPSALGLVGALFAKDKSTPFLQRWWEQCVLDLRNTDGKTDGLELLIDQPRQWFALIIIGAFLTVSLGYRYASFASPTIVIKSDPSMALVATYGDRWFLRPVAEVGLPRTKSNGELLILSGDATKEVTLLPSRKQNAETPK